MRSRSEKAYIFCPVPGRRNRIFSTDLCGYEKDQFFHGVGVDGVYLPFHKANQFLGMEPLPTFIANDVIKMPDVPRYTEEYRKHLVEIFG